MTTGQSRSESLHHMPALDGLRGLAILMVILFHANASAGRGTGLLLDHLRAYVLGAGWVGVDLFFVLSGFLITSILLQVRGSATYYRNFIMRRILRIFPLYFVMLLAVMVVSSRAFSTTSVLSLVFFYYNLYVARIHAHLPFVSSFWSLCVEEQFYLFWPLCIACIARNTLVRFCAIGFFVVLVLRMTMIWGYPDYYPAYYITPCRIDGLLAGSLLAACRRDPGAWRRILHLARPVAIGSFALLIVSMSFTGPFQDGSLAHDGATFHRVAWFSLGPGLSLSVLCFAATLVLCTQDGALSRLFSWRPLRSLGKYSYGMYILHWPLLVLLEMRVMPRALGSPLTPARHLLLIPLLIVTAYACAWVSFHLYEKRFLRLKRFFPEQKVS